MDDLLRNGSGYVDLTAYKAIKNIQKGEGNMEYRRGDLFEYTTQNYDEKEAIIMSADFRSGGKYVSILVLQDKDVGVISVPVEGRRGILYADCGMVSFCAQEKLGNFIKTISDEEMKQIDKGVAKCLGIEQEVVEKVVEVPAKAPAQQPGDVAKLAEIKAEAKVYKALYEKMLEKLMGGVV